MLKCLDDSPNHIVFEIQSKLQSSILITMAGIDSHKHILKVVFLTPQTISFCIKQLLHYVFCRWMSCNVHTNLYFSLVSLKFLAHQPTTAFWENISAGGKQINVSSC